MKILIESTPTEYFYSVPYYVFKINEGHKEPWFNNWYIQMVPLWLNNLFNRTVGTSDIGQSNPGRDFAMSYVCAEQ